MLPSVSGNVGLETVRYDTELPHGGKAPMPWQHRQMSPLLAPDLQDLLRLGKMGQHIGRSQSVR